MYIDYVHVERRQIEETGEYDLEGLFIRLDHAIKSINAKRVLLDTIEVLFAGLRNEGIVRSELRRLFRWLKERGVTAVITCSSRRWIHDHPSWPRRICRRLRDLPRPSRIQGSLYPPHPGSVRYSRDPRTAPTSIPFSSTATESPSC